MRTGVRTVIFFLSLYYIDGLDLSKWFDDIHFTVLVCYSYLHRFFQRGHTH